MSQSGRTGATVSELPPETQTKRELSEWLADHDIDVAWEKRNQSGYDVFHVNDNAEKPDLLIQPFGYNIAVETKDGQSKAATYDALLQTHKYWRQYREGETDYTLDGEGIDIDGFVVANEHSIGGRLFFAEYETLIQWSQFGKSRQNAVGRGELPHTEYSMTELFTRVQWRLAKNNGGKVNVGIGALLSTALDGHIDNPEPAVLWWHRNAQEWFKL